MRRLETLTLLGVLLLAACSKPSALPSDEVLRRATVANGQLQSARYDATVDADVSKDGNSFNGKASLSGVVGHGGSQGSMTVDLNGTVKQGAAAATALTLGLDAVIDTQDLYLRVRTLDFQPPFPGLANLSDMINVWWTLPHDDGPVEQQMTPDPRFLRAQAAVVVVTKDHGIESVNDADAYHYDVAIDPDRLVAFLRQAAEEKGEPFDEKGVRASFEDYQATGELWIDAETFLLHRLRWTIVSNDAPRTVTVTIEANLRDHNVDAPVTIPTDAKPLPVERLFESVMPLLMPSVP